MKRPTSRRSNSRVHDEPVFCAHTGKLIPSDPPSNVIQLPREPRKRPLCGLESLYQPPAVDPGDDI
jgi:hypothetical protein